MAARPLRIGIMGFGLIGRCLYQLVAASDDLEIPVVTDVAEPESLHYLLASQFRGRLDVSLRGKHFETPRFTTRILQAATPDAVPWDAFGVDAVIEATGKYASPAGMQAHLNGGAPRVFLSNLPESAIDRLAVPGINLDQIDVADRKVSAGSATTCAFAYVLKALAQRFEIRAGTMTAIRSYSSDQALQDRATGKPRRSRSAAENIIPNDNLTPYWVEQLMPAFQGKFTGTALNVPVQKGALLDANFVLDDAAIGRDDINDALEVFASEHPDLAGTCADPIVSSDVLGTHQSAIFDLPGTLKTVPHMVKTLTWYDTGVPHAHRLIEVLRAYRRADDGQ